MRILLISDIHANFPALEAITRRFAPETFDLIINGGDTLVYGPFPNQTINWLRKFGVLSILGNTDRHVITLLGGKTIKKPRKAEKRIMYGWTAAELSEDNRKWLLSQPMSRKIKTSAGSGSSDNQYFLSMFHGSPADPDEFLFADTPGSRYRDLAKQVTTSLVTVGHSHNQFHIQAEGVHFINPGSVGRMFDGKISGGCAVITAQNTSYDVALHRVPYSAQEVADEINRLHFPFIYAQMYLRGRKLN